MQRLNCVGVVPTLVVEGVHGNERGVCKVRLVHAVAPLWTPQRRNLVELLHCRHVMEVRIWSSSSLSVIGK